MLYNVVVVSAIHQHESVIIISMYPTYILNNFVNLLILIHIFSDCLICDVNVGTSNMKVGCS